MPVSFTIRLCCKRKVTEATTSGYCPSTASNVRNLFDFHINLMHPHQGIINRGEKFSLYTGEHLGIAFLFPPAAFPLCSVFSFSFSPGVYTHHLGSLIHILKGTTKSSSNCILNSRKERQIKKHTEPPRHTKSSSLHSPLLKAVRFLFLHQGMFSLLMPTAQE